MMASMPEEGAEEAKVTFRVRREARRVTALDHQTGGGWLTNHFFLFDQF
jgi:hypothetical protein